MAELSIVAQAAMDAYHAAPIVGVYPKNADAIGVAAALRAVAAHTRQERISPTMGWAVKGQDYCLVSDIEAIAAELDQASFS